MFEDFDSCFLMAGIAENLAGHVAQSITDKAMQELKYLCCYNSYADDFAEEKTTLTAKREIVLKKIEEAKNRNENQIEDDVQLWLTRANGLIEEDTNGKKKWFGVIPNCFWQYKQGKELEGKTIRIKGLIEESNNFPRVARSTGLPGIEFYSSQNFMDFEERTTQFEKLKEALKDDKKFMIGLYGLGGTGKTTMALQVGKEVEESKVFDKVIFSVVSKDSNLKNIRDNIAKHLNLSLDGKKNESEQAQELWKRIREGGEKVLIILDDAWEKLERRDIGIPLECNSKGCCTVLVTTRDWRVCRDMGCDEIVKLEVLNENDAVDLFLSYAGKSTDDSSNDFKDVAKDIVKECGKLPVAIVAVARALKSRPLIEWKDGLKRLQHLKSIHDVNEDLKEAYNSLRLSYDYLKNEEARKLFLLCSLFPEDYEIPIELLTRISIGLRLCGEASRCSTARSHFTPILNELMDSCLLLKGENGAVKMHDLVREVALWIGNEQVQVDTDSSAALMDNIQYSSRNIVDFLKNFGGRKLEVLLLWISNNGDSTAVKVSDGIFEGMESLKILTLMSRKNIKISAASVFQSHLSLINVRALVIKRFELGDISILANLKILESLELSQCSMTELPKEIGDLEKLRLLEVVQCAIGRNNPFEVIGNCLQLEELYFISNRIFESTTQIITTFPKLERYQIKACELFYEVDFSISGYFECNENLRVSFSNKVFKSLVARVEVLKLDGDYYNGEWTNIVPNIFSKLVELKLSKMNMRGLCCSPCHVNFLKKLEKLQLSHLENLEGSLFDEKLELCNLKSIHLHYCSIACLFSPFTAHSLKQLETLEIEECSQLKHLVAEPTEEHDLDQKSQNDSMFPKLKDLIIKSCPVLEFVFPMCICGDLPLLDNMLISDCEKLEYIIGKCLKEGDLHQMRKEAVLQSLQDLRIYEVPNFINIYPECYLPLPCSNEVQKSSPSTNVEMGSSSSLSGSLLCCFWPKSNASSLRHHSASTNINQVKYVVNGSHGLLFTLPLLYPASLLRSLKICNLGGLKSLFTLSIASSLKLLQQLQVRGLDALENIVTVEEHGHGHMNVNYSIFPNLQEADICGCSHLEYIFPAFYSTDFKDLECIEISKAERLTHVFGKCQADQSHNVQVDINLPVLKKLCLADTPNMVNICAENYSMMEVYLEEIVLEGCPKLFSGTPSLDLLDVGNKRQVDLSGRKELCLELKEPKSSHMSFQNLQMLILFGCKELKFIFSVSTSGMLKCLKNLHVSNCEELESIIEDDEENKNPMAPHQVWFPELRTIEVRDCKSMKSLFSIPIGKIPRLLWVDIEDAPQLVEVFGWKHGEEKKLVVENVFPKLIAIILRNLPVLSTICQGIDFQTSTLFLVSQCPAFSFTPAKYYDFLDLYELAHSCHLSEDGNDLILRSQIKRSADEIRFDPRSTWKAFTGCNNLIIPKLPENEKVSEEVTDEEDSTTNNNMPNLIENIASTHGEGPSSEKYDKASSSKELRGKEPMADDQQAVGEIRSSSSKEKSNKMALMIPPSNNVVHKASSSTPSKLTISNKSTSASTKELYEKESKGDEEELGETTSLHEVALEISPTTIGWATPSSKSDKELCGKESMVDQQALGETGNSDEKPAHECSSNEKSNESKVSITSISSPKMPQIETFATEGKKEELRSFDITDQTAQGQTTVNQRESPIHVQHEIHHANPKQVEEDDLIRLFRIMRDGSDLEEFGHPYVSDIAAFEDDKVAKAFADVQSSLKMDLNQMVISQEHTQRLENALNFLSSSFSVEEPSSHGLVRAKIENLHQEIKRILSSFKEASDTFETLTKLEEKEKWIDEQHSQRMVAATNLVSEIRNTEEYVIGLKEQISRLKVELKRKEKELEDSEMKLSSLHKQKNECVLETIGFMEEYETLKKDHSYVRDGQTKARQELNKLKSQWPSHVANLKKTAFMLGILLKNKP